MELCDFSFIYDELEKNYHTNFVSKSADSSIYSYKEYLAITDERVNTSCVVTSGEKSDGPILEELYHKSKDNSVSIKAIVGDKTYSGKDNIQSTKKNVCI